MKALRRIFLVLTMMAVANIARADDNSALKSELEGRYAALESAMAARDASAMRALLAPDFVSVDVDGSTQNADEMISQIDALPHAGRPGGTRLLSVTANGDTVTVEQEFKSTTIGPGVAQRAHTLIILSTDTWVKVNGSWVCQRTVTDEIDRYVNGTLISHVVHR